MRIFPAVLQCTILGLVALDDLSQLQITLEFDFNSTTFHKPWFPIDAHASLFDTCFKMTVEMINANMDKVLQIENSATTKMSGNISRSCNFHYDAVYAMSKKVKGPWKGNGSLGNASWQCILMPQDYCDGKSECLKDECGCVGSDSYVFFCADKSGCIDQDSLCDGINDCPDRSDECFCDGFVAMDIPGISGKVCMDEQHFCSSVNYLLDEEQFMLKKEKDRERCDAYERDQLNEIEKCMNLDEVARYLWSKLDQKPDQGQNVIVEYCQKNCTTDHEGFAEGWLQYCDRLNHEYPFFLVFECNGSYAYENRVVISKICDGNVDCKDGSDEKGCPGQFYCDPERSVERISETKICDHHRDCSNGADECGTCKYEAISSSESLISSNVVLAVALGMAVLIIAMCLKEGYKCWTTPANSKVKKIDRIFILQIFFHDILMGVYLCFIAIASIYLKYKESYCIIERKWRASVVCSGLGILFSFSSHGSLLVIALISITRFITCRSIMAEIKIRSVITISLLVTCLNIMHSILPLIPISLIQDIFRTGIYFINLDQNPFFNSNPLNISRLEEVYEGMFGKKGSGIMEMLNDLKNITTKEDMFEVLDVSYYGNTGLCVHNIFKSKDSYETYKILYCSILLILLGIVSITYVMLVLKQYQTKRDSGVADGAHTMLTIKVALMIASQLICWFPFVLATLYFQYQPEQAATPMVFEIFFLVLIPLNSFLNPIFYSDLYKKTTTYLFKSWGRFVQFTSKQ